MKLTPMELCDLVKKAFPYEGDWHYAQLAESAELRQIMPNIVPADDVRKSGKQFLLHKREMVKVFKFLSSNRVVPDEAKPWKTVPLFVVQELGADYLHSVEAEIERLIRDGTENQLGGFLAGTAAYAPAYVQKQFAGCYARMHRAITAWEKRHNTHTEDSNMDDPCVAHFNAHFWGLSGWIDNLYAAWQQRHNLLADQSPVPPTGILGVRVANRAKFEELSVCGSFLPLAKRPKVWLSLEEWRAEA
ncbi:MAG: hypothetical protein HY822_21570 [Acidobacteria bacterium]|nr:hypothetical protein [Acidobacteriota bacterium]